MDVVKEFHLFAGIGGGIYGGVILGHQCCGSVEIDDFCRKVLKQRQLDGWMDNFPSYGDIHDVNGADYKGKFDILCGGFPCQAFSYAAHGNNIAEKNLWPEMLKFVKDSDAPVVFGENVTVFAIENAVNDLRNIGYAVEYCRLSCLDLGADHKRPRFWLLAVKDSQILDKIHSRLLQMPKFTASFWSENPNSIVYPAEVPVLAPQKKGVGNAQAPMAAAVAFRLLVNRHISHMFDCICPKQEELKDIFVPCETWIHSQDPDDQILVHTPTTMGNYHYASMQKHPSCVKYVKYFGKPVPLHAEYLMGFPIGASSPYPLDKINFEKWKSQIYSKL